LVRLDRFTPEDGDPLAEVAGAELLVLVVGVVLLEVVELLDEQAASSRAAPTATTP